MIPLREQEYISERFTRELEGRVKIDYFTQRASALYVPGREPCAYCEDTRVLLEELAAVGDKITLTVHELSESPEEARKLGIDKVPGIAVRGPASRPISSPSSASRATLGQRCSPRAGSFCPPAW